MIRISNLRSVAFARPYFGLPSETLAFHPKVPSAVAHGSVVGTEGRVMTPTPTTNETLPFRVRGFVTLAEGLDYAAQGRTGCNFFSARGELEQVLPYKELRRRARDLAARLGGSPLHAVASLGTGSALLSAARRAADRLPKA